MHQKYCRPKAVEKLGMASGIPLKNHGQLLASITPIRQLGSDTSLDLTILPS
jgi:hypothetical protein